MNFEKGHDPLLDNVLYRRKRITSTGKRKCDWLDKYAHKNTLRTCPAQKLSCGAVTLWLHKLTNRQLILKC